MARKAKATAKQFDPLQCWRLSARQVRCGATLKTGPYRKGVGFTTVGDATRLVVLTAARYNAVCRTLATPKAAPGKGKRTTNRKGA